MRILIISDTTGYMRGGVPAATRELIDGLVAGGHAVGFCGDIPIPGAAAVDHFPIVLPVAASLAPAVEAAIRDFRPHLVHVVSISSPGVFRLRGALRGVPWLMTCHSIPPYERKLPGLHGFEAAHYGARALRYLPHALAWRWLLTGGSVPHVVVHSPWVRGLVVDYGQPAATTTLIPLGSAGRGEPPVSQARPEIGPTRLVTVGGIAHTKGLHDAVHAVGLLRERFAGLRYQIVGEIRDPSYLRFLRALVASLNLGGVVSITPDLPEAEKNEALAAADLYLQPSHEEGFCLAYIEAARIVPRLVGTATGAIGLVSEGDALARVVPPRRPRALADAVAEVMGEPLPAGLMAGRRDRLDARFGWSGYVAAHEALYRSLLEVAPAVEAGPRSNRA